MNKNKFMISLNERQIDHSGDIIYYMKKVYDLLEWANYNLITIMFDNEKVKIYQISKTFPNETYCIYKSFKDFIDLCDK